MIIQVSGMGFYMVILTNVIPNKFNKKIKANKNILNFLTYQILHSTSIHLEYSSRQFYWYVVVIIMIPIYQGRTWAQRSA